MLCPLARCAVLVDDYYVKYRPVDQVERLVGSSNWRKLHGIVDTFALVHRLLAWVLYPIMMTRLMASRVLRSRDWHFTEISREIGKLLTKFLLIRKDAFRQKRIAVETSQREGSHGQEDSRFIVQRET